MNYKIIESKRFHNMNAKVKTVLFSDGMMTKRLISYNSVVVDICSKTGTVFIYPRYHYSPTTIRQVTRFLNENVPLDEGWSIGLIRKLNKEADSNNGHAVIGRYTMSFLVRVLGTDWSW